MVSGDQLKLEPAVKSKLPKFIEGTKHFLRSLAFCFSQSLNDWEVDEVVHLYFKLQQNTIGVR